ncbi:MAG: cytochrome-c peroxidase [Vicingaceae bacterium]|nr:MAG: cytochrome-c peroxidase [Vicingaceae bacterium]
MKKYVFGIILFYFMLLYISCRKDYGCTDPEAENYNPKAELDNGSCIYDTAFHPTPYPLNIPPLFAQYLPEPHIPEDNPLTVEGVALGKKLFYDPGLSANGTQSCASCHMPGFAFTDSARFSTGIDGIKGTRNAMPIFNALWNFNSKFFWDGRANGLEQQALEPIRNPIEMHNTWENVVNYLKSQPEYVKMFKKAFGTSNIDSMHVVKAIAQFERILISANSKFDRYLMGLEMLTPLELQGFNVYMDETRGDCFHCHGTPGGLLWTDNDFHNNGLDSVITDPGLAAVTGNPADMGKFKTPSLRNLAYTAPYMHDGRFKTLDEVINHYSEGLKWSPTIDPLMKKVDQGGVQLTPQDKAALKAFLLTLSDPDFINNPEYRP